MRMNQRIVSIIDSNAFSWNRYFSDDIGCRCFQFQLPRSGFVRYFMNKTFSPTREVHYWSKCFLNLEQGSFSFAKN